MTENKRPKRVSTSGLKPGDVVEVPVPRRGAQSELQAAIGTSPELQALMQTAMGNTRKYLFREKVRSNAELVQRLGEFFEMASQRTYPPTVEEMSLYLGYNSIALYQWKIGLRNSFADTEPYGTTAEILAQAYDLLHSIDAVLASTQKTSPVAYIFRAKNWYGMKDRQDITVQPVDHSTDTMSREQLEEIAAVLPDE